MRILASVALPLLFVTACGNHPDASSPTTPTVATPAASSSPTSAPTASESAAPAEAAPPVKRKPFELYNACTDVATVVVGADPKAADAGKRTVAPSSSIDLPRDADGNQMVWLLDAKGEPLVKVHVSRGMKRVEIGRSCRTIDAR